MEGKHTQKVLAAMTGTISALEFILKQEKAQRRRLQRRVFKLCVENAGLGGSQYKRVLKDFGLRLDQLTTP